MSLILGSTNFGTVFAASGIWGFFGDSCTIQDKKIPFPKDVTFIAKTMTTQCCTGDGIPVQEDGITPIQDGIPNSIIVHRKWPVGRPGFILNAVGLRNPGAAFLLEKGELQKRTEPFFLSFAPMGDSIDEKIQDTKEYIKILHSHLSNFRAPIGLELNLPCPNISGRFRENKEFNRFVYEVYSILKEASRLGIPLITKLNLLVPGEVAALISKSPYCAAISLTNSIPYGSEIQNFTWEKESPLKEKGFAPGALSGTPLYGNLMDWFGKNAYMGIEKPIIAGGGIVDSERAYQLLLYADAISLGSVFGLAPQEVSVIIEVAKEYDRELVS